MCEGVREVVATAAYVSTDETDPKVGVGVAGVAFIGSVIVVIEVSSVGFSAGGRMSVLCVATDRAT